MIRFYLMKKLKLGSETDKSDLSLELLILVLATQKMCRNGEKNPLE